MRDGRTVGLPGYAACALALEDARRPGLRPAPAPGARRAVAAARAAALGLPPVGARVRVVRRASVAVGERRDREAEGVLDGVWPHGVTVRLYGTGAVEWVGYADVACGRVRVDGSSLSPPGGDEGEEAEGVEGD